MRGLLDQRLYGVGPQLDTSGPPTGGLLSKRYSSQSMAVPSASSVSSAFTSASQLSSLLNCASIAELAGSAGIGPYDTGSSKIAFGDKPIGVGLTAFDKPSLGGGGMSTYEHGSNSRGMLGGGNPYERWSNGSDSLFGLGGGSGGSQGGGLGGGLVDCGSYKERMGGPHTDMLADLVGGSGSKLLSGSGGSGTPLSGGGGGGGGGGTAGPPLYPPKSQIKRQKMIYHCKFGEFGILGNFFNLILYGHYLPTSVLIPVPLN
jgi:hypothetical protein